MKIINFKYEINKCIFMPIKTLLLNMREKLRGLLVIIKDFFVISYLRFLLWVEDVVIPKLKKKIEKMKNGWKKFKNKSKQNHIKRVEKTQLMIVKSLKVMVNIDIGFIFIFLASYFILPDYIWWMRLLGSIGMYYFYIDLKKYFERRFK